LDSGKKIDLFRDDLVQYYDVVTRELKKSQKEKVRKFIENGCVEEIGHGVFLVHPIKGYNKTTYRVSIFERDCNCQHATNQKKYGVKNVSCSHIFAVIQFIRRRKNGIVR
jgi:hypothetical protein